MMMDSISTHTHSTGRPLHPNTALYRGPSQLQLQPPQINSPATSLPSFRRHSMTPATGFDPANDFRTFYPYIPNEVKHRKRTTRSQQLVLEEVFQTNTKPNAALRKELAMRLDMQARGVQVWFQNRRAKEKKKQDSGKSSSKPTRASSPSEDNSGDDASPNSSPEIDVTPDTPIEGAHKIDINIHSVPNSPASSPAADVISPSLARLKASSVSPSNQSVGASPSSGGLKVPDAHLLSLRRGSLPVNAFNQNSHHTTSLGPPSIDSIDPLARRRSIDTSIHRLAQHPYARLAMEKNGLISYGPSGSGLSSYGRMYQSRNSMHRGSLPGPTLNTHLDWNTMRYPSSGLSATPSPSPLSPSYAARAGLVDRRFSAPRTMAMNIPGPLPSPTFSFGAPSDSPPTFPSGDDHGTPDPTSELLAFSFPVSDRDEDDNSSTSRSAFSRGSIVSLGGSETSNTSAYFSEISSSANFDDSRRGSCASNGFLELMSGLDVNSGSDHSSTSYPSPTPTISAPPENEPTFTISKSSELAFALTGKQGEISTTASPKQNSQSPEASPMAAPVPQYFYNADTVYPQPESIEFTNPFEVSSTGNYHAMSPFADGPYTASGQFASGGEGQVYGAGHQGTPSMDAFAAGFHHHHHSAEASPSGVSVSPCGGGDSGLQQVGDAFVASFA